MNRTNPPRKRFQHLLSLLANLWPGAGVAVAAQFLADHYGAPVGADAVVLIVAETVFLMLFILVGIFYLGRTS